RAAGSAQGAFLRALGFGPLFHFEEKQSQRSRRIMLSLDFQEEPMTLQVALIGKDGFVLASDKKDVAELWSRRTSETRKILVSEKRDLVCAFSGHPLLSAAATRLLEFASEPGIDIAFSLKDGAQRTLDHYERNVQATIHGDLIVLILGKHPQLWSVAFVN